MKQSFLFHARIKEGLWISEKEKNGIRAINKGQTFVGLW
jgi:hypothetical protein